MSRSVAITNNQIRCHSEFISESVAPSSEKALMEFLATDPETHLGMPSAKFRMTRYVVEQRI